MVNNSKRRDVDGRGRPMVRVHPDIISGATTFRHIPKDPPPTSEPAPSADQAKPEGKA